MTSSPGNASAVFDRYRAEGHTLFDPDRLTRLAASADRPADSYDELLEADGAIRPAWADLARIYQLRGPDRLRESAARLAAAVSDDGVGMGEAPIEESGVSAYRPPQRGEGLGMQILRTLVASELRGSIRWQPRPGGGTTVTITAQVPGEAGT